MTMWTMSQSDYHNAARFAARGQSVELDFSCGELDVAITQGVGYGEQFCSVSIPEAVLIQMLAHRGYTISSPLQSAETATVQTITSV